MHPRAVAKLIPEKWREIIIPTSEQERPYHHRENILFHPDDDLPMHLEPLSAEEIRREDEEEAEAVANRHYPDKDIAEDRHQELISHAEDIFALLTYATIGIFLILIVVVAIAVRLWI